MAHRDWNSCYATDQLPWDSGFPDTNLVEFLRGGRIPPGRALEVGCGTGTNAWWLAGQGFDVLGVDVSPLAIEKARAKATPGATCRFEVADFLAAPPAGPFDVVLDRGCWHVFDEAAQRLTFAANVAAALAPGGHWLSLIGSTEGPPRDVGPPRRSARDVTEAIEPVLEIVELRAVHFDIERPIPPAAWLCVSRRRDVPAQPSTRHL
jgi:SAM-dependent methyltransferase